jgi:FO synthase
LVERLPLYPSYVHNLERWVDPALRALVLRASDSHGWARGDRWAVGGLAAPDKRPRASTLTASAQIPIALARLAEGQEPDLAMIETLFAARGADVDRICRAADELRQRVNGDAVGYVVNRNINYTNICLYSCGFCAFSKGSTHADLRGTPYDLDHAEIARRVREAEERGASEVCLQGGIHPAYTGETYLEILRTVRAASPNIHIHAFSPLEVSHGASTLGLSVTAFLERLQVEGLGTLPGTAAEILDDEIRQEIAPDKVNTQQWLEVIEAAHNLGLRTTATIMFGHVEQPHHWARHLLAVRQLQARTGGFTEFVPLPFVHMEAPMARRGLTRRGPTIREVRLMHAVARLVLHPLITNIQTSWTKIGPEGAALCLGGGANDLGGTLMNESISRAAGSAHGQEFTPHEMETLIRSIGRRPAPRTTTYGKASEQQVARAKSAGSLTPLVQTKPKKSEKKLRVPA